jgi:hypothetical protein
MGRAASMSPIQLMNCMAGIEEVVTGMEDVDDVYGMDVINNATIL